MLQVEGHSVPRDAGHPHYPFNEPFWRGIVQEEQCLESHITNKCDKCHKCTPWSSIIWCVCVRGTGSQTTGFMSDVWLNLIYIVTKLMMVSWMEEKDRYNKNQKGNHVPDYFILLSLIIHTMRIKSFQKANMYCKHSITKLKWKVGQVALKWGATVGLLPRNHDHSCLHGQ